MSAVMERLLLIGVIFTFISGFHCDRKITTNIKHGCYNDTNKCGSYGYIEAVGEKDTLHYLVSTLGLPTIFVAYTDKDVTAQVDLDGLLSPNITERQDTVTFTPSSGLKYSYAVAFTKLIDYNDTKDKADMTEYSPESTAYNVYDLGDFMWTNLSVTSTPEKNIIVLEALNSNKDDHELWLSNGTFSIQLSAFSESGREDQLPHLQYNENITQFDLNMDHLYTNLSKSRFAVEVAMIGSNAKEMHVDETRSIDDEYSPGVFTIYNWLSEKDDDKGFLQWKPVCYKSLTRSRAEAIAMKHYKMRLSTDIKPYINTLAYGYYGDKLMNTMINVGNFSFGISQDGGYNKTQVLTWSGSIGYGMPPADSISKLVIIIISAGLGLPVVLIIFGGIFVCIKKRNQPVEKPLRSIQGQGYQPLPNN